MANPFLQSALACGLLSGCAIHGDKTNCMNEVAARVPAHGEVPQYLVQARQFAQAGDYRGCLVALGEAEGDRPTLSSRSAHEAWVQSQLPEKGPRIDPP